MKSIVFSGHKVGLLSINRTADRYSAKEIHIHPNYTVVKKSLKDKEVQEVYNDIALVKLDHEISNRTEDGLRIENSICLPEAGYKEGSDTLTMSAGHGTLGYPYNQTGGYDTRPLQLGYRKVVSDPSKIFHTTIPSTYLITVSVGKQAMVCQVGP